MRKRVFALVLILAGCGPAKTDTITAADAQQQIDSIVGERMQEINVRAMEDLDRRMSIEVKVKADSIVAARTKADTATQQP